jgi:4-hydroxy-2-oxoheptanedioate aldolase
MRIRLTLGAIALATLATPTLTEAQARERLNPMIALHEQGLPVFGVTHPSINAARGRGAGPAGVVTGNVTSGGAASRSGVAGATTQSTTTRGAGSRNAGGQSAGAAATARSGATPNGASAAAGGGSASATSEPAPPALADVARETLAYGLSDFEYNSYSPAAADRFMGYVAALIAQGGSMREHAFISKVPIVHGNVEAAQQRIIEQLNMGHAGIFMQQVETAAEVKQAVAAMRFRSQGGIRPETGIGLAAAYWGLSQQEYLQRADVWPINPNGELVIYAIVESRAGVANVREIAAEPGVAAVVVGAGTLGGVFSSTNAAGERVRDQAGFDAAVAAVVAACKEFKKACSYPANNPADIERLMNMGFSVFTMQSRNQAAFDAVETGRRLSGRPMAPR